MIKGLTSKTDTITASIKHAINGATQTIYQHFNKLFAFQKWLGRKCRTADTQK